MGTAYDNPPDEYVEDLSIIGDPTEWEAFVAWVENYIATKRLIQQVTEQLPST